VKDNSISWKGWDNTLELLETPLRITKIKSFQLIIMIMTAEEKIAQWSMVVVGGFTLVCRGEAHKIIKVLIRFQLQILVITARLMDYIIKKAKHIL